MRRKEGRGAPTGDSGSASGGGKGMGEGQSGELGLGRPDTFPL